MTASRRTDGEVEVAVETKGQTGADECVLSKCTLVPTGLHAGSCFRQPAVGFVRGSVAQCVMHLV